MNPRAVRTGVYILGGIGMISGVIRLAIAAGQIGRQEMESRLTLAGARQEVAREIVAENYGARAVVWSAADVAINVFLLYAGSQVR